MFLSCMSWGELGESHMSERGHVSRVTPQKEFSLKEIGRYEGWLVGEIRLSLIKCLKDHKSPGLLCGRQLGRVGNGQTDNM